MNRITFDFTGFTFSVFPKLNRVVCVCLYSGETATYNIPAFIAILNRVREWKLAKQK